MKELLAALKDVEGLIGACALDAGGRLLGRDLPAYYDDETLVRLNQRFDELFESTEEVVTEPQLVIARFSQTCLLGRNWDGGRLIVFCTPRAHPAAVKTAANLTAKRLGKLQNTPSPLLPKPSPPASAAQPPAPGPNPAPAPQPPTPPNTQKTRTGIWG
ncbi:MAG: hypothetical protein AAGK14_12980 [Verrucomicrobiota bacterium]